MEIDCVAFVFNGNLYRFYIDGKGEVVVVHLFEDMGTRQLTRNLEDMPTDVINELEKRLTK